MLKSKLSSNLNISRNFRSFPEIFQSYSINSSDKENNNLNKRPKFKNPQKRASFILSILKSEEYKNLRQDRSWPLIQAGDSVEVERF